MMLSPWYIVSWMLCFLWLDCPSIWLIWWQRTALAILSKPLTPSFRGFLLLLQRNQTKIRGSPIIYVCVSIGNNKRCKNIARLFFFWFHSVVVRVSQVLYARMTIRVEQKHSTVWCTLVINADIEWWLYQALGLRLRKVYDRVLRLTNMRLHPKGFDGYQRQIPMVAFAIAYTQIKRGRWRSHFWSIFFISFFLCVCVRVWVGFVCVCVHFRMQILFCFFLPAQCVHKYIHSLVDRTLELWSVYHPQTAHHVDADGGPRKGDCDASLFFWPFSGFPLLCAYKVQIRFKYTVFDVWAILHTIERGNEIHSHKHIRICFRLRWPSLTQKNAMELGWRWRRCWCFAVLFWIYLSFSVVLSRL